MDWALIRAYVANQDPPFEVEGDGWARRPHRRGAAGTIERAEFIAGKWMAERDPKEPAKFSQIAVAVTKKFGDLVSLRLRAHPQSAQEWKLTPDDLKTSVVTGFLRKGYIQPVGYNVSPTRQEAVAFAKTRLRENTGPYAEVEQAWIYSAGVNPLGHVAGIVNRTTDYVLKKDGTVKHYDLVRDSLISERKLALQRLREIRKELAAL